MYPTTVGGNNFRAIPIQTSPQNLQHSSNLVSFARIVKNELPVLSPQTTISGCPPNPTYVSTRQVSAFHLHLNANLTPNRFLKTKLLKNFHRTLSSKYSLRKMYSVAKRSVSSSLKVP